VNTFDRREAKFAPEKMLLLRVQRAFVPGLSLMDVSAELLHGLESDW
jgi:hypothetical protein